MRLRLLRVVPLLAFLAIAGAAANTLYRETASGYAPGAIPSALIGRKHPATDLRPVAGLGIPGLSDAALEGKVVVLNVFASWCVPCRQEHPALMELARDPRIRLAGINYKDAQEKASAFLQENGNPYAAVGADIAGRTSIDWGVYGVPETFVLDRNGRVMFKHVGPLDSRSMRSEIIPQLETLLVQ